VEVSAVSVLPHFPQNFAPGRIGAPQDGQPVGTGTPHSSQNRLPLGMVALQLGHSMPHLNLPRRSAYHRSHHCGSRREGTHPARGRWVALNVTSNTGTPCPIRRDVECGRGKHRYSWTRRKEGIRLTDPEWALIEPLLPEPASIGRPWKHGRGRLAAKPDAGTDIRSRNAAYDQRATRMRSWPSRARRFANSVPIPDDAPVISARGRPEAEEIAISGSVF
jgi:hypothetical protein